MRIDKWDVFKIKDSELPTRLQLSTSCQAEIQAVLCSPLLQKISFFLLQKYFYTIAKKFLNITGYFDYTGKYQTKYLIFSVDKRVNTNIYSDN